MFVTSMQKIWDGFLTKLYTVYIRATYPSSEKTENQYTVKTGRS